MEPVNPQAQGVIGDTGSAQEGVGDTQEDEAKGDDSKDQGSNKRAAVKGGQDQEEAKIDTNSAISVDAADRLTSVRHNSRGFVDS